MLKDMSFYHLREKIKKLLDRGLDSLKTASKKVVHKTGEFLGNKIADVMTKSNDDKIAKQEPAEEIIILPKVRDEMLSKSRHALL